MRTFLLMYILVYGGMHIYAFLKARAAFGFGWRAGVMLALLFVLMVAGPILVRVFENRGMEALARVTAFSAYSWFGLIFLFFCFGVVIDTLGLGLRLGGSSILSPGTRASFFIVLAAALVAYGYGVFENSRLRVERMTIETDKLGPGIGRVRIVQLSDVHLGLLVGEKDARRFIEAAMAEKPDIIVITGDLIDGLTTDAHELWGIFAAMDAPMGKFAVLGNHEYYAGLDSSIKFIRQAGFRLLRDEAVEAGPIIVAGADYPEPYAMRHKPVGAGFMGPGAPGVREKKFVLMLRHLPIVDDPALFDLQLSGHTHKGQMAPFTPFVRMSFKYIAGLYELGGGSRLYVSRGTGTWGPPIRVNAPPEIAVIDLVAKGQSTR